MKAHALRIGKAISAALFVLLLVAVGSKNALAQNLVATLQHGDTISTYYGINALTDANTTAVDGDIITLSSGTFHPTPLTKSITLRGAGVVTDTIAGTHPTRIDGTLYVYASNCTLEGIYLPNTVYIGYDGSIGATNTTNPRFYKCNINYIRTYSNYTESKMTNGQFVNCKISELYCNKAYDTQIVNSVVDRFYGCDDNRFIFLVNSIVVNSGGSQLKAVNAINSILYYKVNGGSSPSSSCSFINCIGIKSAWGHNPFGSYAFTDQCAIYNSLDNVFESFNGTFSFDEPYNLKEEIVAGFTGNDGTQVGIYGGYVPYNPRPSYMVVKRCNVASQSTIDGKLSVDIEVVTEGE